MRQPIGFALGRLEIMAIIVNVHEAKTHLSRLLEQVHAGQELILAKAGKPYARLVPLSQPTVQRQPGRLAGKVDESFFERLPEDELRAWEGRRCGCRSSRAMPLSRRSRRRAVHSRRVHRSR